MASPLFVTFAASNQGSWAISGVTAVVGTALPQAERLAVIEGPAPTPPADWVLRGVTSNTRYTSRSEVEALAEREPGLARPQATCAALIPIRKSAAWWTLAQDERRTILEEKSHHIAIGLEYLPAIARRLHHSRELGEPFDFLTWFEFAPEDTAAFDDLVGRLRQSEEWHYVEHEIDIRLSRVG